MILVTFIRDHPNQKTTRNECPTGLESPSSSNFSAPLGLFDWKHMSWAIDEDPSNPSLEEMTRAAINTLDNNDKGYFLFVEGAYHPQK